jgi:hypothetical protein
MTKPPLDVDAAARVARHARIVNVSYAGIEARLVETPDADANVSLTFATPDLTGVWDVGSDDLRVLFPLRLNIEAVGNESETGSEVRILVAEFTVAIRADYVLSHRGEWTEEDLRHFVGINVFLHVWPYFRAEIQSLTSKLALPPLTLPPIVSGHAAKMVSVVRVGEMAAGMGTNSEGESR